MTLHSCRRAASALVVCAALATPAAAGAAWGGHADLSDPTPEYSTLEPVVAIADDGRALALWARSTLRSGPLDYAVEWAARPSAGAPWSHGRPLGGTYLTNAPALAATPGGDAVAAWALASRQVRPATPRGFTFETRIAARAWEGGRLSRATMPSPPGLTAGTPVLATGLGGETVAVWPIVRGTVDGPEHAVLATSRPAGGEWRAPVQIAGGANPRYFASAGGADGSVVAAWLDGGRVITAERTPGGGWGAPVARSGDMRGVGPPAVAVAPDGQALVAWHQGAAAVIATLRTAGAWEPPVALARVENLDAQPLESLAQSMGPPAVAIDERGAVAAWRIGPVIDRLVLQAAVRPRGAAWRRPATLDAGPRSPGRPALAVRSGRVVLVWSQPRTGRDSVLVSRAGDVADGRWRDLGPASQPGEDAVMPSVAIGRDGRAVAVYVGVRGSGSPRRGLTVRAAETPAPAVRAAAPVPVTAGAMAVNRRLARAALRRADAVIARLGAVTGADVRDGSLGPEAFAGDAGVSGVPADAIVPPGPVVPVAVPADTPVALATPTRALAAADDLLARTAAARVLAAEQILDAGLTGGNVVDGALTAADLAPGLTLSPAAGAGAGRDLPAVAQPRRRAVALTAATVAATRRTAQQALWRADALVAQVESGFGAEDFVTGSLGGIDLAR